MVNYCGENWQNDILSRDYLENFLLIDVICSKLYPDIPSNADRRKKLFEIPEMVRLRDICKKQCSQINKIKRDWDLISTKTQNKKEENMNDTPEKVISTDVQGIQSDGVKIIPDQIDPVDAETVGFVQVGEDA